MPAARRCNWKGGSCDACRISYLGLSASERPSCLNKLRSCYLGQHLSHLSSPRARIYTCHLPPAIPHRTSDLASQPQPSKRVLTPSQSWHGHPSSHSSSPPRQPSPQSSRVRSNSLSSLQTLRAHASSRILSTRNIVSRSIAISRTIPSVSRKMGKSRRWGISARELLLDILDTSMFVL